MVEPRIQNRLGAGNYLNWDLGGLMGLVGKKITSNSRLRQSDLRNFTPTEFLPASEKWR
jgi:hypothetical protein